MSQLMSFIALAGLLFFPGCSFPVRRLPPRRNRLRHYALGAIFKFSGRLKRK